MLFSKLLSEVTITGCHSIKDAATGIPTWGRGGVRRLLNYFLWFYLYFGPHMSLFLCQINIVKKEILDLALALPCTSYVTLGKLFKLYGSQLVHLWNECDTMHFVVLL